MPALPAEMVPGLVAGGASCRVDVEVTPKFKPGDRVTARNINPTGHTRLPRYIRGKTGVVDRDHGVFAWPDTSAHGQGETPQHVYSVRFTAQDLWGADAPARDSLYIDLWDNYIDAA